MSNEDIPNEDAVTQQSPLLAAVWRRWWLIVLCITAAALAALGLSLVQTPAYTATASLLFRDSGFDRLFGATTSAQPVDPDREAATNVALAGLQIVDDRTARVMGAGLTGDDISGKVTVEAQGQSNLVAISATDPDPEFAARLANAYARAFVTSRRAEQQEAVDEAIAKLKQQISSQPEDAPGGAELAAQLKQLQTLKALQTGDATIAELADVPTSASSPATTRNVVLGGILGMFLGIAASVLFARADRRLRTADEFEAALGAPLVGEVPDSPVLAVMGIDLELPRKEREAFRMIDARLRHLDGDDPVRTVLIASGASGEGKSTVAWQTAIAAARSGRRVAVIEADLQAPRLAGAHGLDPAPGLTEVLTRQVTIGGALQEVPLRGPNGDSNGSLNVLAAGGDIPSARDLFHTDGMRLLLEYAAREHDLVLIDAPALGTAADAMPLAALADGVLLVVRPGVTTIDEVRFARSQIEQMDSPILGVVMNLERKLQRVPRM